MHSNITHPIMVRCFSEFLHFTEPVFYTDSDDLGAFFRSIRRQFAPRIEQGIQDHRCSSHYRDAKFSIYMANVKWTRLEHMYTSPYTFPDTTDLTQTNFKATLELMRKRGSIDVLQVWLEILPNGGGCTK